MGQMVKRTVEIPESTDAMLTEMAEAENTTVEGLISEGIELLLDADSQGEGEASEKGEEESAE